MILCKWDKIPKEMQTEEVKSYYSLLSKKKCSLFFKRVFDVIASIIFLIVFSPLFLVLACAIKLSSKGPVFYRQVRITQYGKKFRIHKFRSMRVDSDNNCQITAYKDARITKVGKVIRKLRLDEISQLLDVLAGNMTFVGTRPEVPEYVEKYKSEYMATLLLPAGITSTASVRFRDEDELLKDQDDVSKAYAEEVLPIKMQYNLEDIKQFSCFRDIKIMLKTVFMAFAKNSRGDV